MTSDPGYLRIATEEAFAPPELVTMWRSMLGDGTCDDRGFVSLQGFYMRSKAERPAEVLARLQDLGERRIADMDAAGVDRQVISLTSPGTQILDLSRPGESRACGMTLWSSGPRPGPWRVRLRSR